MGLKRKQIYVFLFVIHGALQPGTQGKGSSCLDLKVIL